MSGIDIVVAVVAVAALVLVAVTLRSHRRGPAPATAIDEALFRRLLAEALPPQAERIGTEQGETATADRRALAGRDTAVTDAGSTAGGPPEPGRESGRRPARATVTGGAEAALSSPDPAAALAAPPPGSPSAAPPADAPGHSSAPAVTTRPGPEERDALLVLRQEALDVAQQIRQAAAEAAAGLTERSRADAELVNQAAERVRLEARADAERTVAAARTEASEIRAGLKSERAQLLAEAAAALADDRAEVHAAQGRNREAADALRQEQQGLAADRQRLHGDREEMVRHRAALEQQQVAAARQLDEVRTRAAGLDGRAAELDELIQRHEQELTRVSGLTVAAARSELLAAQEESVRRDAALMIRRIESEATAEAKTRARAIVTDAVQRVAADQTAQTVVSVVHLPAEEIKGRIIGREGRNIRTFETVTGVNVIIDDTPEAVLLSCFDPVRREVGRITLQMLIDDGRIHPHRIEEAYERAVDEVESLCAKAARDALLDVGIIDIHPELEKIVGRLKYRTSYGQNVLGHSVETSHLARVMAAELGIPADVAARGAFLHDIGKALTHEAQGSHAIVGAELARRFGESEEVAHCIEAHHDEVPPATVEAVLTQAADACSGGRPGARRESLESYVQRLQRIEAIAAAKRGVDKVFAMQAGRELRVMVKPDVVDDLEAHVLAREVAKQIEEELTYPGQVRVTVIRESRSIEIAR